MLSRPLLAILLTVPLLAAGCANDSPVESNAAKGVSSSSLTENGNQEIEIARELFDLSATTGLSYEFDVEIPANATGLEVRVERSGTQVNFAFTGLGQCDHGESNSVNVGSSDMRKGCGAPSARALTVAASMDGGEASFVFIVKAHIGHVDAP